MDLKTQLALLLASLPAAAAGCSAADGEAAGACGTAADPGVRQGAIYGGTSDGAYLALGPAQETAVVRIEVKVAGSVEVAECSGVLLSGGVVLTARHCVEGVDASAVSVLAYAATNAASSAGTNALPWLLQPRELRLHPDLDLAALVLDAAGVTDVQAESPGVAAAIDGAWTGRRALLAGFGYSETDDGIRLFATEEIVAIEPQKMTVAGFDLAGGCLGDSGGPLLARDDSGAVVVLGILSSGSTTCRGYDELVRLDAATAWIKQAGAGTDPAPGCGALSAEGRCFDGRAVWCEQGRVSATSCTGTERCGWDETLAAYRCVDPAQRCAGADDFGACTGGRAVFCHRAVAESRDCGGCARCGFDAPTGRAACFPVP